MSLLKDCSGIGKGCLRKWSHLGVFKKCVDVGLQDMV